MRVVINRVDMLPPRPGNGAVDGVGVYVEQCQTPDGVIHSGPGCVYRAARHLIGKGVAPKTRMKVYRDGKAILIGTLHAFAIKTWSGRDRDPLEIKWKPHPNDQLPPALAAWYAAQNP